MSATVWAAIGFVVILILVMIVVVRCVVIQFQDVRYQVDASKRRYNKRNGPRPDA